MESFDAILTAAAALLAAFLGVICTNWYNRPRPWLGLSSVDRDDTSLIEIPNEVTEISEVCNWTSSVKNQITLYQLKEYKDNIAETIVSMKTLSRDISDILPILNKDVQTDGEKIEIVRTILGNRLIRQIVESNLQRGAFALPNSIEKTSPSLFKTEEVLDSGEVSEKGIVLYNQAHKFVLVAGKGFVLQDTIDKTRQLAEVFNKFQVEYIKKIIDIVNSELQIDIQHCYDLEKSLSSLLKSRKLKVKAKLSNLGAKPIHIHPFGLLQIFTASDKKVDPLTIKAVGYRLNGAGMEEFPRMIQLVEGLANKQGVVSSRTPADIKDVSEFIIANPGTLVEIDFTTLEENVLDESTISALEEGVLSSQIIIIRADNGKQIKSQVQTSGVGISNELKNILSNISQSITK